MISENLIAFYCDYKLINIKGKENEQLYEQNYNIIRIFSADQPVHKQMNRFHFQLKLFNPASRQSIPLISFVPLFLQALQTYSIFFYSISTSSSFLPFYFYLSSILLLYNFVRTLSFKHLISYIKQENSFININKMFTYNFNHLNTLNFGYTPFYYPSCYYGSDQTALNSPTTGPTFLAFNYQPISILEEAQTFSSLEYQLDVNQTERTLQANSFSCKKNKMKDEKKILRPKKNVESNISNQVFSYITNEQKSGKALSKILKQNKQKIELYYIYAQSFAKSKKKYLSRKYLGDLCIFSLDRQQCLEIQSKNKLNILSLEQFRSAVSFLIFHYLRSKCTISVLTSMKLSPELRRQHLERKRQILTYLEQYVRPDFKYGFR